MNKLLFLVGAFLCFGIAIAQTSPLDRQLQNVNQSTVTSGIIYDRTYQKANLYNYNSKDYSHTAEYSYFRQSLLEMHRASNATKFISLEKLEELLTDSYTDNIVEIGILNT